VYEYMKMHTEYRLAVPPIWRAATAFARHA